MALALFCAGGVWNQASIKPVPSRKEEPYEAGPHAGKSAVTSQSPNTYVRNSLGTLTNTSPVTFLQLPGVCVVYILISVHLNTCTPAEKQEQSKTRKNKEARCHLVANPGDGQRTGYLWFCNKSNTIYIFLYRPKPRTSADCKDGQFNLIFFS